MDHEDAKDTMNAKDRTWVVGDVSHAVIGAALRVHSELGPGLLESVYEKCLALELRATGHEVIRQVPVQLLHRGERIGCAYRADLIVDGAVLVEVKSVQVLEDIHLAQVLTYLRLTKLDVGLLVNFNVPHLKAGLKRVLRGQQPSRPSRLRGEFRDPRKLEDGFGSG